MYLLSWFLSVFCSAATLYDQQKGITPSSSAIKRKTKTNRDLRARLSLHLNFALLTYPELQFCCYLSNELSVCQVVNTVYQKQKKKNTLNYAS